jgi:hypothetical protein
MIPISITTYIFADRCTNAVLGKAFPGYMRGVGLARDVKAHGRKGNMAKMMGLLGLDFRSCLHI